MFVGAVRVGQAMLIRARLHGEFTFFVGGGVAVFDCDGDAMPDVYLAGGTNRASLYRNASTPGGELRFAADGDAATTLTGVTGAYPLDIDADGNTDLAVLRLGENVVLRGHGDCRFTRANEEWGIDGGEVWTAAFSATWEGDNALPTLAFGGYVAVDTGGNRTGGCSDNVLLRPDGMRYADPVPLTPSLCTLSMLFSDWSRTGQRDLRITNDRQYYRDGEEQLWRIADGEAPRLYTREEGWQELKVWGMGIASHDVTGDGLPEVYLTSMGDNKLQSLTAGAAQPRYGDIAFRSGVTAHRPYTGDNLRPSTAWHAEFQDVNNDGFVDLYVAKGNVDAMPEFAAADPNNLLLGQADATFVEGAEAAGIVSFTTTRGAALADFNLDGMLDLIEVNRRENVAVWRNVGWGDAATPAPMGNWLGIRLEQDGSNRDAIGAWLEVRVGDRTTWKELTVGGGHAGGPLGWVHAGLGDADGAEVRVQWPDGEVGPWMEIDANKFVTIARGAATPVPWPVAED